MLNWVGSTVHDHHSGLVTSITVIPSLISGMGSGTINLGLDVFPNSIPARSILQEALLSEKSLKKNQKLLNIVEACQRLTSHI